MKSAVLIAAFAALIPLAAAQQEPKPVPKDSVRVTVAGCVKGYIFTAVSSPNAKEQPTGRTIPDGMHLRMNGPKKVIKAIDEHNASMVEITGLMRKDQFDPEGVRLGGGVRVSPGQSPTAGGGGLGVSMGSTMPQIDVEGWNPSIGDCPPK